jgi:uncharacterized membrane protein YbhN (UPF0104 family)
VRSPRPGRHPAASQDSPQDTLQNPVRHSGWRSAVRLARPLIAVLVLGALIWTIVDQWRPLSDEFSRLSILSLVLAALGALLSVAGQMLCWRELLADLGSPLPLRQAGRVFFLGQLGKYLPGSVWPVVAQMELARDLRVPRARTATTVLLFMLMNVVSAGVVAGLTLPFTVDAGTSVGRWRWAFLLLVLLIGVLHPAVLNRLTALGVHLLRRPPPEERLSVSGVARAFGWTVGEWIAAGVMLAALLRGFGDQVGLPLAIGAFALAWGAGFVVVVVPAGAGVREAVLVVLLSGQVGHATALAAALAARLLMTVADALWALLLLPSSLRGPGGLRAAALGPSEEPLEALPASRSDPEVPTR